MPRYSDRLINEVIGENDIVDYISQYVRLKSNGRDYVGLCPFHKEKSPSFHVNREKQVFHCFGCGAGGGLMQFVMRAEGLDFVESLKLLAERAGIVLPEQGDIGRDDALYKQRKTILEINRQTARFYYEMLTRSAEGKIGLDYLFSRRISPKTIVAYGLGYSPRSYDALLGHLRSLGFSDKDMIDANVVMSRNGKIYDRFAGRVMFPIIDLRGNVIGFGGRILEEKKNADGHKVAKYLNTSATPVFDKGRNLFSLNLAKKANSSRLILCEGYMDVISVYQAGIPNIVATLGTALTENQARLLKKYCSELLLCYDSDEAGQKATRRAIDICNSAGIHSKIIEMKGAKDPDEYIKANGAKMFEGLMDAALPSSEYLIRNTRRNFNLDTEDGKIGYVNGSLEALVGVKDPIEVDAYIKKISRESGISADVIYAEYKKLTATHKNEETPRIRVPEVSVARTAARADNTKLSEAGMRLLGLCCRSKKLYGYIAAQLRPDEYTGELLQKAAQIIYESRQRGEEPEPSAIMNSLTAEEAAQASKIFCIDDSYSDNENAARELIVTIKKEKIGQMLAGETDPAKIVELIKMRDKLGRS